MAVLPKRGIKGWEDERGKGTKLMAVADRNGLPFSLCIENASPHEVTLVDCTLVPGTKCIRCFGIDRHSC
jgi:hypothetical protein